MRSKPIFALLAIGLISCASSGQQQVNASDSGQDVEKITAQLQSVWDRCLTTSFKITSTETPDKNEAAEMAFAACQTEQDDLTSVPNSYSDLLFPHLKAATKEVLIEGGSLP